jgi:glutamate formiminotransferase
MKKIIECIPNFSEGQDNIVIDKIANTIRKISQVKLLHIDSGFDANRTVITFAGEPKQVIEAAFRAIEVASKEIDMTIQKGEHPRIGATDVCPLVPISGISMEEVVQLSKELAHRVGTELYIPVYLYENSSNDYKRKNLEDIRRGEYEGLPEKMSSPEWMPDFGPLALNERTGATVIGARNFLIAYNININTKDISIAKAIAAQIRAKSKSQHRLDAVKAIGWYMEEYNCCQISTNITDFHNTNIHEVYEKCKELAKEYDLDIIGSELIGLIPKKALLQVGIYYENRETNEFQILKNAIHGLGLNSVEDFVIEDRVIEFLIDKISS